MLEAGVEEQVLACRLVQPACVHVGHERLRVSDRLAQLLGQPRQPPLEPDDDGQVVDDDVSRVLLAVDACLLIVIWELATCSTACCS
jgi:hypothetical protein